MQAYEVPSRWAGIVVNWFGRLAEHLSGDAGTRVERVLHGKPHLALNAVFCSYCNGVLTLHGRVATTFLKRIAVMMASQVDGIEYIENEIEVVPSHYEALLHRGCKLYQ